MYSEVYADDSKRNLLKECLDSSRLEGKLQWFYISIILNVQGYGKVDDS
jgi:hypothetical protein